MIQLPGTHSNPGRTCVSTPASRQNFLSLLQVACYVYHSQLVSNLVTESALAGQAPICSYLIYNPSRRYEVWRFFTYQFVHVNMEHIVFNTLMQLVVGLPLEMSQPGLDGTMK